jgi:SAM-dependent MidA family methyltransferase
MEEEKEVEQGHLLEKKKTSGRLPGITEEMVQKYYHYPVSEAAELLGAELGYRVDFRNLKRRLRDFGIERWPYQQVKHGPRSGARSITYSSTCSR